MLSDLGLMVAAVYFSSFMFIIIPALGAVVGAVTANLTRLNIALGAIIGIASGFSGIGLAMLTYWAVGGDGEKWLVLLTAFGLPLGGAFAPIAILQLFRPRRGSRHVSHIAPF